MTINYEHEMLHTLVWYLRPTTLAAIVSDLESAYDDLPDFVVTALNTARQMGRDQAGIEDFALMVKEARQS